MMNSEEETVSITCINLPQPWSRLGRSMAQEAASADPLWHRLARSREVWLGLSLGLIACGLQPPVDADGSTIEDAVVKYLSGKGVARDRPDSVGSGQTRPIADHDTDQGRATPRRVELVIVDRRTGVDAKPTRPADEP